MVVRNGSLLSASQRRSSIALAEALLPGTPSLPGADEDTVQRVENFLAHLSPWVVKFWARAQQTMDAAAVVRTGRRFHSLSTEKQQELLHRWEHDKVLRAPLALLTFLFKLTHFDAPRVMKEMGVGARVLPQLEQERWMQQMLRPEDWDSAEEVECDVVVIGTGAGGAVVGRELAEKGHAVLFVEEGRLHRRDEFDGSHLTAHNRFYRGQMPMSLGNSMIALFMGKMVGGSTAINTGTSLRTPDWVLNDWCERMNTDELSPANMRPYFDKVEEILNVGTAELRHIGPIADVIGRGCDKLGWEHFRVPRNAVGCEGQGFCDLGCPTGARKSTDLSYVPQALTRGAMMFTGLRAESVRIENGKAVGLDCVAVETGKQIRVRSSAVVMAGGAVPSPLMLLKQGICNTSGEVGRNLSLHPSGAVSALFDDDIDPHNHIPQGYGCNHFLEQGLLMLSAQPAVNMAALILPFYGRQLMEVMEELNHLAAVGVLIKDEDQQGRVWFDVMKQPIVTYNLNKKNVKKLQDGMVKASQMWFAAGAKKVMPLVLPGMVLENKDDIRKLEKRKLSPADFMLSSYHPLGTCKMGERPKSSVVGLDHQTHDVEKLYIVDGSTVPGPPGVNPQITIMAMATRAAEKISEQL